MAEKNRTLAKEFKDLCDELDRKSLNARVAKIGRPKSCSSHVARLKQWESVHLLFLARETSTQHVVLS